jgi:uncharacterized protein involved in exopolysaccharide biosynthesis
MLNLGVGRLISRSAIPLLGPALVFGLLCGIVGAGSAFIAASQLPKVYEARASLIAPTMADTFAEVADSRLLLQDVVSRLGLSVTPEALAGMISAFPSKTSALLTIVAHDSDPVRAAAIADAVAAGLVQMAPDISGSSSEAASSIDADLTTTQAEIARTEGEIAALSSAATVTPADRAEVLTLQTQLATLLGVRTSLLTLRMSYSQTALTVLGDAQVPTKPAAPQSGLAVGLGGLAGIILGIGIGLLVMYRRKEQGQPTPTIRSALAWPSGDPWSAFNRFRPRDTVGTTPSTTPASGERSGPVEKSRPSE